MKSPLITLKVHEALLAARGTGAAVIECSLDSSDLSFGSRLPRLAGRGRASQYPYLTVCKDRTVYRWTGATFEPVSRFTSSLIKLVPTEWGAPTFEIDGIKMLPSATVSPYADAERKVGLIQPRGKRVLDTCGGLGYFAAWCLKGQASHVLSFEKSPDVIWLRGLNPWSPSPDAALTLTEGDVSKEIALLPAASFDAILHDPPRFGIAGELYSQAFYDQMGRVIRRKGRLFHYTGTPNKLTSGRDVPNEVATRLRKAGFSTELNGDGVLAVKK
ncbi:MAG: SAM-dependent methyltransferase [Gammaproteobacteria bacterium]